MKKKNVLGVIVLILALSTSIVVNANPSTSDPFANANTNPNAPDSIWKSSGYVEFRKDNETAVFDARDFQTVSDKISALATKVDEIDNDLDEINSNLCGISFAQDANGNWGYRKPGADSVTPFNNFKNTFTHIYSSGVLKYHTDNGQTKKYTLTIPVDKEYKMFMIAASSPANQLVIVCGCILNTSITGQKEIFLSSNDSAMPITVFSADKGALITLTVNTSGLGEAGYFFISYRLFGIN